MPGRWRRSYAGAALGDVHEKLLGRLHHIRCETQVVSAIVWKVARSPALAITKVCNPAGRGPVVTVTSGVVLPCLSFACKQVGQGQMVETRWLAHIVWELWWVLVLGIGKDEGDDLSQIRVVVAVPIPRCLFGCRNGEILGRERRVVRPVPKAA